MTRVYWVVFSCVRFDRTPWKKDLGKDLALRLEPANLRFPGHSFQLRSSAGLKAKTPLNIMKRPRRLFSMIHCRYGEFYTCREMK